MRLVNVEAPALSANYVHASSAALDSGCAPAGIAGRLESEGRPGSGDTRGRGYPGISRSIGLLRALRSKGGVWDSRPANALGRDGNSLRKFTIFFHQKGPLSSL
jgi:hypothetical protein